MDSLAFFLKEILVSVTRKIERTTPLESENLAEEFAAVLPRTCLRKLLLQYDPTTAAKPGLKTCRTMVRYIKNGKIY